MRSFRSPGRVNIIGEHIDYLGGTVLPFACDLEMMVSVEYRPGPVVLASPDGSPEAFIDGVVAALDEAGIGVEGCEGTITSTIPVGAGLSSSSSLVAAVALAVTGGQRPTPSLLLRAEEVATGVHGGLMDQTAILNGRAGHALVLDCATGDMSHLEIPTEIGFVMCDSGTRRRLADGRYNQRRAEVERGDARRVRHAESEQRRVHDAVDAIRAGDAEALGALIHASHLSLRDDFEVSSPELDATVVRAMSVPGCHGARLVGAGFAGCVLAVVDSGAAVDVASAFDRAWIVRAVDGAGEIRA